MTQAVHHLNASYQKLKVEHEVVRSQPAQVRIWLEGVKNNRATRSSGITIGTGSELEQKG